jgi:hypothetical protein
LHSSVSCCMCFMLFGESGGVGSDGGMARQPGNVVRRAGGQWTGRAMRRCPTDEARSGHGGGGVRVRGEANGLESRQTERVVHARRVVRIREHCDGTACAYRTGKKKSTDGDGLRARRSGPGLALPPSTTSG